MLSAARVTQEKDGQAASDIGMAIVGRQTMDDAVEIGEPNFWLWRVTWHKDSAFGIGYGTRDDNQLVRLYRSRDGRKFETIDALVV